jgi:hypothetical protein
MTIRRYSIGARGEHVYHDDGPHVSYSDHVKAVREVTESWANAVVSSFPETPQTAKDFWAKLGGDRKTI